VVKAMPKEVSVVVIVEVGHSNQTIKLPVDRIREAYSTSCPIPSFNRATGLCP